MYGDMPDRLTDDERRSRVVNKFENKEKYARIEHKCISLCAQKL